ncbi:MAG: hypothetical protein FWD64_05365 [Acidobacteriaceae bacterium]|nr:hypothetical protein [Acidobacteriaceae bacterium]
MHDPTFFAQDDASFSHNASFSYDAPLVGGLVGSDVFHSPEYLALQDGVALKEITPHLIDSLAETMMGAFGMHGVEVIQDYGEFNAGMQPGSDAVLSYDPNFLWSMGQQFGPDAIVGIVAHEVGHHIADNYLSADATSLDREQCADCISGVLTRMYGLSPDAMDGFYANMIVAVGGDDHPLGGIRSDAFHQGYDWASDERNQVFSHFLLQDPQNLAQMLAENLHMSDQAVLSTLPDGSTVGEHSPVLGVG